MINFVQKHKKINQLYISVNQINNTIERFKQEITKNKDLILEMQRIDITKCNQTTDINKIIELLDAYKNENVSDTPKKEIIIASYYGTPYITVNLCIQALLKRKAILLVTEDSMLAVNKVLVTIFNTILEEYKIMELVKIFNLPNFEEINNISKDVDEVICIGNSNTYQQYKKMKIENLKFIHFKNMVIYTENLKYEDIQHELYKFATTNGIEVEVYDDVELDEFIECMELDSATENVVVLTEQEETKKIIQEKIKNKKIYVNKNPFKNENFKINI